MSHLAGEGQSEDGRLDFDRRIRVEFHGSKISSDGGLLLFRQLDDVLGLHDLMGEFLVDTRIGHNRLHSMVALARQSIFGRLSEALIANAAQGARPKPTPAAAKIKSALIMLVPRITILLLGSPKHLDLLRRFAGQPRTDVYFVILFEVGLAIAGAFASAWTGYALLLLLRR